MISKLQMHDMDRLTISSYIGKPNNSLWVLRSSSFNTLREGNRVAHLLAREGFLRKRDMQWVEDGPSIIWGMVKADRCRVG